MMSRLAATAIRRDVLRLTAEPGLLGNRLMTVARSAQVVAAVVLLVYGVWIFAFFLSGHSAQDLVHVGRRFAQQSRASQVIHFDPSYHYAGEVGRDGQMYYFIAVDPANARYYVDSPSYRYQRILYPLLARLLAFGQASLIPYSLFLLNWVAIGIGTLALAAWLRRKSISPWFALVYGLYPGLLISLADDVTEATSYAMVAVAIYLFDFRRRFIWAALTFALAMLARETAVAFVIPYGLSLLFSGDLADWRSRWKANWPRAGIFFAVALGPFALYQAFLFAWLGAVGQAVGANLTVFPFAGLLKNGLGPAQQEEVRIVVLPAMICLAMGAWAFWKRIFYREIWVLLANILPFVVLLGAASYVDITGSGRITIGVVLAAIACLPSFDRLTGGRRTWFWISSLLWLSGVPFLLLRPIAHNLRIALGGQHLQ